MERLFAGYTAASAAMQPDTSELKKAIAVALRIAVRFDTATTRAEVVHRAKQARALARGQAHKDGWTYTMWQHTGWAEDGMSVTIGLVVTRSPAGTFRGDA